MLDKKKKKKIYTLTYPLYYIILYYSLLPPPPKAELNFLWNETLYKRTIEHPNPKFQGKQIVNHSTGEWEWITQNRIPKVSLISKYFIMSLM